MKSTILWVIVGAILFFGSTANAWGGLFNRFSPEMLANMGYGSHGGGYRQQPFYQAEGYLEDEMMNEIEPCYDRPCTSNEDCCPATVCVHPGAEVGKCVYAYGRKLGEYCNRDSDCDSGLVCDISSANGISLCRIPIAVAKQYAEECTTSTDCDITRGLCCQLQRRHRQAPRKVCSYFKDPLICIGTVAVDQIKHEVQHTAGEKRITSQYNHHHGYN